MFDIITYIVQFIFVNVYIILLFNIKKINDFYIENFFNFLVLSNLFQIYFIIILKIYFQLFKNNFHLFKNNIHLFKNYFQLF